MVDLVSGAGTINKIDMAKSQLRDWAQNRQDGPTCVKNGRQAPRIGPNESYVPSGAFGMGPEAQNDHWKKWVLSMFC